MWSSLDVVVNKFQRLPGVSKTYLERQVKSIVQEESHGDAKKAATSRVHCFPKISELLFINHFLTENHLPLSYWWPLGAEAHPGPWSGELCFLMQMPVPPSANCRHLICIMPGLLKDGQLNQTGFEILLWTGLPLHLMLKTEGS